jgi:hypothetical protein
MIIEENFLELVDIEDIEFTDKYVNMVDIKVKDDESFLLENGIISHNSASGGLIQSRDTKTVGVYALRGKIKNVRSVSDLAESQEVVQLMNILGLELNKTTCDYEKVVIATDADCIDAETYVKTKLGDKKIKDINHDDLILTDKGRYVKIKEIIKTIKTEFVEVKINNEIFICSKNHKLIILRDGKTYEIEAHELTITDHVLILK